MPEVVDLKARGLKDHAYENEQLAQHLEDAAKRARRGDFKSVCWIAWSREESAEFGWLKFGSILPLLGCLATTAQEMANSPNLKLSPLPEDDDSA